MGGTITEEPEDNASMMNMLELDKSQEVDTLDGGIDISLDDINIDIRETVPTTNREHSKTREEIELEMLSEYAHIETTAEDIEEPLDALHNLLEIDADMSETRYT